MLLQTIDPSIQPSMDSSTAFTFNHCLDIFFIFWQPHNHFLCFKPFSLWYRYIWKHQNIAIRALQSSSSSSFMILQFILIIVAHTADVLVSLSPFPHWVSLPWPITMTMGAGSMDTVTRQPAASGAAAAARNSSVLSELKWSSSRTLSHSSFFICMQVFSLKRKC